MTPSTVTTAAITGAAGSLGRALTRRLLVEGQRVRALVRNPRAESELRALGADPVVGDVTDPDSLQRLVAGAQVVHHLAAWTGTPPKRELADAVNVRGTRRVLDAAAAAGVRRVVLASSIAVYGPVRDGVVSEDRPPWAVGDPYGDSKIAAERAAREVAAAAGLELVILRPTVIYGPASPSWTLVPFEAIARGRPVVIGDGEDLLDAVFVDDVARAFALAAGAPEAAGEAFNVGGSPVTWNEFMGAYARMAGVGLRRVPAALAWNGARAVAAVTRPLLRRPLVVPELVGVMTSRATFPHDKARRVLGYVPETGLSEGMAATEAWLRASGRLRRPRVALVTGAGGGLGLEVATQLAERGIVVYAADVDPEALARCQAPGVRHVALDVTDQESVRRAVERVAAEEDGGIDLLVNVAGLLRPGALEEQPWTDVELQFAVNAMGPLALARAVAPAMRRRGYGRIVNVSSTNGFMVTPFMGAYSASKYALEALSDALRLELAPWGVEVAVVQPGAMRTSFSGRAKDALRSEIERPSDWSAKLQGFLHGSLWGDGTATPAEVVARRIVRIALARRLRPRLLATADAWPTRAMAMLPDRLKDAFFARAAGLSRQRRLSQGG
jgi:nucleoside-diphosphate-sugar epimerase